ncbi:DeoR/GlpR transcriptional regulator [Rhodobacteraceae bacterium 2376]|uniref:DeoR/GlpR transcriptional regulator n=1 Tax=Rhabdonatronobacter sediminivivens TaxID=2743469 RepID=A0A7Z0I0W5_9RHOB|nr:DeoR/GlpR family DNA-binding transcription regulator [Rhabdonatronobacter sediminivivens]NYS25887.1 DeoR/GlpR transcriptional regulator [Rhabdonatronobacter sediminivivens]
MSQNLRLPEIMAIARREGRVGVERLAAHFGVTVQTIRRDLAALTQEGKLERVHGGAVVPSAVANIGYEERRALNEGAKAAIAARCAQDIPDGSAVFLNIGTTTEAVARALLQHRDIMVLTNNMNVANILVANPECEIILVGGLLRRTDGGLVGTITTRAIQEFKFDLAVISCSALDEDGDLLDFDIQEVGVSQTIIAQARQSYLVADCSKFRRRAPARIASLRQLSRFYTDSAPPRMVQERCALWETAVILAGADPGAVSR